MRRNEHFWSWKRLFDVEWRILLPNGPWKEKQLTVISLNWHHSPFTGYSCSTIHHIVHSAHHTHVPKCIGLIKRSTMAQIRRHSGDHMNMTEPLRTQQNPTEYSVCYSVLQTCWSVWQWRGLAHLKLRQCWAINASNATQLWNWALCVCVRRFWSGFLNSSYPSLGQLVPSRNNIGD